jgi:hypothetical protein
VRHIGSERDSNDESVHVEANANVNVNRFTLPKDPREIMVAVVLALSIFVNVWCLNVIHEASTEDRLKQYNLDWFKTHEFADLRGEMEVNQKLITAFGPQQCKR